MTPSRCLTVAAIALAAVLLFVNPSMGAGSPRVEWTGGEDGTIVVEFELEEYDARSVRIEGNSYLELEIPGEAVSLEAGAPALPHVSRGVILPDDARMEARVVDAEYHDVFARVAPSKGNLSRSVDPRSVPWVLGPEYASDAWYPAAPVELGEPYILRDVRGAALRINPFLHNPAAGILRVYTRMTIELRPVGPGVVNVLRSDKATRGGSRAFEELYRGQFLNAATRSDARGYDEEGEMLILCDDAWVDNMAPFVAHKATVGIDATVVPVSTVGASPAAIQSWVQAYYDAHDLAYLLLVGDIEQIPSPDVWANGEYGASDASYSRLAGSDDYPDILVGRFSARSAADVDTQVARTIAYENLPANDQEWFWRATGIASAEGAGIGDEGQSDQQHEDEIRQWLLAGGYTEVDRIYDPGASDSNVAGAIHAGRGLINYTGHGSASSWGTTSFNTADVNALTNTGMLPVIFSVACNNGEFENYATCFAEAWLRATSGGEPTGAAAIYASTVSQSWAPPMEAQDAFNLLRTDPGEPHHFMGSLCYGASVSMMDAYGSAGVEMFETWVLFGDPSLRIIGDAIPPVGLGVAPGAGLEAQGPAGGAFAPGFLEYTLRNYDDAPLEWTATASESWFDATPSGGTIPAGESAIVRVALDDRACNMDNGSYQGAVQFVNVSRHEGDTVRSVRLDVGVGGTRYLWNLDEDPGWTTGTKWQYGTPRGLGGWGFGFPDPGAAATGAAVYGTNLSGDISPVVGGPYYLTGGPFDLSGDVGATLHYQRWLNLLGPPTMRAMVEISTDGTTWSGLWSPTGAVQDSAWVDVEHDLTSVAGDATVWLRWGYAVEQSGGEFCSGWNLDDIEITSVPGSARMELSIDLAGLSWSSVPRAVSYDLVRGDLGALHDSGGDFTLATTGCVESGIAATSMSFTEVPEVGEGYWFLARGVADSGPLTYQTLAGNQEGLRDAEIAASPGACP